MTESEMLELAAKAAGMPKHLDGMGFEMAHHPKWNPLADDGDALRLAVKLGLTVAQLMSNREVLVNDYDETVTENEFHEADSAAATRRAITLAAAKIGRNMP